MKLASEAQTRSTYLETKNFAEQIKTADAKIKTDIESLAAKQRFELPLDITARETVVWRQLISNKGPGFDNVFLENIHEVYKAFYKTCNELLAGTQDSGFKKVGASILSDIASKEVIMKKIEQLKESRFAKDSLIKPDSY